MVAAFVECDTSGDGAVSLSEMETFVSESYGRVCVCVCGGFGGHRVVRSLLSNGESVFLAVIMGLVPTETRGILNVRARSSEWRGVAVTSWSRCMSG